MYFENFISQDLGCNLIENPSSIFHDLSWYILDLPVSVIWAIDAPAGDLWLGLKVRLLLSSSSFVLLVICLEKSPRLFYVCFCCDRNCHHSSVLEGFSFERKSVCYCFGCPIPIEGCMIILKILCCVVSSWASVLALLLTSMLAESVFRLTWVRSPQVQVVRVVTPW